MNELLKHPFLTVLTLVFALLLQSGCVTKPPRHLLQEKSAYVAPPEGIAVPKGGLLFRTKDGLKRITGAATIPAGWIVTGPVEVSP